MTAGGRRWRVVAAVAMCGLALAGCRNVHGVAPTRAALEEAGFRDVELSFHSGGGIDLVRVDAVTATGAPPGEQGLRTGAEAVWRTLPLRFDQLLVSLRAPGALVGRNFGYEELTGLFGARAPGLDRRQVGDEVVESGLKLVVLLSAGGLLSVGLVVGLTLFALRNVRRRRSAARGEDHAEGDGSFPGLEDASPTAGASAAEGEGAIPS